MSKSKRCYAPVPMYAMLADNVRLEASTELSTTSFTLSSPRHIRFQLCEGCFLELIGRYAEEQSERPGTTVEKKRRVCPTLNGKSECGSITEEGGKELEDLAVIQRRLAEGRTVAEIYEEYPQIAARYPRFVDRAADYATPERTWKTEVKVFKGPTGCGKTRLAHELYPGIWTKPAGVWFDSYDRHPHVLIDDFAGGRDCGISFRDLLRFLDRYPMDVPIKGVQAVGPPSHRHHH